MSTAKNRSVWTPKVESNSLTLPQKRDYASDRHPIPSSVQASRPRGKHWIQGKIGRPIAGTAFMCGHGHESWHPNPAFYYDIGGGPMLDMGPYYVTALVNILGPVKRVAAITTKAFEERVATSQAVQGLRIPVKITTHLTGTLEFQNGAIITMIMSFDMWRHSLPCIEIYGETGSMTVPDPNGFRRSRERLSSRRRLGRTGNPFPEQCSDDWCH